MSSNPFDHIEEAWGLDGNPFPHTAISTGDEPYSPEVFQAEAAEFNTKVVRGALQGNRQMAFLWSKGPGGDTGYGKTSLMHATVRAINDDDWGEQLQLDMGMKPERVVPVAAGFSEVNTMSRTGLFPVVFNAVLGMAAGDGEPLVRAHARIANRIGTDGSGAIADALAEARRRRAPTGPPLRADVRDVFCDDPASLPDFLGGITPTTQLRSGIEFLHFALIAFAADGIEKVFLMIDQLEDLATNKSLPASKRRREIGRIRDLMETEPFASMLHQTFTFHATAARELDTFWEANRLPSFEDTPSNQAAVVVLRGLRDDDQVAALLKAWMEPHRNGVEVEDDLVPFEPDALSVLRAVSQGRPGPLLNRANELFDAGATAQVGRIDAEFARQHFSGSNLAAVATGEDDDGDLAPEFEDLLA